MASGDDEFPVYAWKTHGEGSWSSYKGGYLHAIDILISQLANNELAYLDKIRYYHLVYPIMFLSRHYIELELKQVIALGSMMDFADEKKKFKHKLTLLWAEVLGCVENFMGRVLREEFEVEFNRLITMFDVIDPNGDSFRYPKDFHGKSQWNNSFNVDILDIKDRIALFNQYAYDLIEELRRGLDPEAEDISDRVYFY
jgi:hypothetical protein